MGFEPMTPVHILPWITASTLTHLATAIRTKHSNIYVHFNNKIQQIPLALMVWATLMKPSRMSRMLLLRLACGWVVNCSISKGMTLSST